MSEDLTFSKKTKNSVVEYKAFKLGFIITNSLVIGLMVLRIYFDEPIGDLLTVTLSSTLVVSLYRSYHMSSKLTFVTALIMGFITIGILVATLLSQYGLY